MIKVDTYVQTSQPVLSVFLNDESYGLKVDFGLHESVKVVKWLEELILDKLNNDLN